MANLFQPSLVRATDSNGRPISNARLYFYATGTLTAATWFTDQDGTIEGTNPHTANSGGVFSPVYLDPDTTYRIVQTTSDGTTVWDVDPVRGFDETQLLDAAASAETARDEAVPAAAAAEAARDEAEALVGEVSTALAAGTVSDLVGTRIYTSKAALDADLVPADGLYALVVGDATAANNDLFKKNGATTAGSWTGPLGFFSAASAAATDAATLAGHYANDDTDTDVSGGAAGERGAKYWSDTAAASAATIPDVIENVVNAVQHIGPSVAVAGTSIGNVTVIMDKVPRDISRITIQAVWRAAGTLKVKAWNDTTGAVTTVSQAVTAGDHTYEIAIPIAKGDRLALFGNGLLDRTANAGPATGYYSLAGDVSTGALSTQVKNYRVDAAIDLYGLGGETRSAGDAVAQSVATRRNPGAGYGSAALGTALSDSNNAWGNPRPLPSGFLRSLTVTPQTNGWFTLLLAQVADHQLDVYRTIQIDASAGTVTLTDSSSTVGKRIPKDCFVRPDTVALWHCPTSGGQISYTATDGPNPVGENVIGALLPVGNYSCPPVMGLQTPSYSSSNRFYAAEFIIDEVAASYPSDVVFSEAFGGTARPVDMIETGGAWTYAAGSATSNAAGLGRNAHLRSRIAYCFDNRALLFRAAFYDTSSIICMGTRPIAGAYGTVVKLDYTTGQVSVGNMGGATSDPVYFVTQAWPGTFSTAKDYDVSIARKGRGFYISIREVGGNVLWTYSYDLNAAQIPPLTGGTGTESNTLDDIGMVNGAAFAYADAGRIVWKSITDAAPDRNADLLVIGDSISNASRNIYTDGWAQQLRAIRAANGKRTAIMAVDGWDCINMAASLQRIISSMTRLKYVIVEGGTNRASSDDARALNIFKAQVAAMKIMTKDEMGAEFYFAPPAPFNATLSYPGPTTQAAEIAWIVQQSNITLLRYDLALTVGGDGVTIDYSKYYGAGDPHPVKVGHDAVVARLYTDTPRLL